MHPLRLVPVDTTLLVAYRESPASLARHLGVGLGAGADVLEPVLEQTAAHLAANPRPDEWGCFLAVDDAAGSVVGTCGYKLGPAADGSVEIAYYSFPQFEGRGYATAMAKELTARAAGRTVLAHTLPERNASCRVLEKVGFVHQGEVHDPDDGRVWRWVRAGEPRA